VRGRGLEPRWLLTASTSIEAGLRTANDSKDFERQETPESVPKRPIPVACDKNSGGGKASLSAVIDAITARLTEIQQIWVSGGDRRSLRRALLELLRALDE
jgi:hypothetical protein